MPSKMLRSLSTENLLPSRPKFMRGTSADSGTQQQAAANNASNGGGGGDRRAGLLRSLSKDDVLGAMAKGTGAAARGLEMGVKGVSVGASYGFQVVNAAGAAGAAGAAELANGALGRPKPSTCRRRQSELNVFGDDDLVSVDFLLQNIKAAEKKKDVTKLELEDLVNGKDNRDAKVYEAVSSLLKNDSGRSWVYIKFIDNIRVSILGDGLEELKHYEKKRQALWDNIKQEGAAKPIMFSMKIEIEEDTKVKTIIEILNELQEYNLARIEYMGGLFGYKAPEIGEALADLCRPDDPDASIEETGELREMIMLTLHYAAGGGSDSEKGAASGNSAGRDRVWRKVLRRCVKRLGGQVPPSLGDSEHGFGVRSRSRSKSPLGNSSDHSRGSRRSSRRHGSPTTASKKQSETDLMRAAIAANRAKSPKRSPSAPTLPKPTTVRRATSEGTAPPQSMGGSSHGTTKRRKPRSFASTIAELDLDDSDDSARSFGDDSSDRNNHDNKNDDSDKSNRRGETTETRTKEEEPKRADKAPAKPLRRGQGVVRSASSPMQKRDPMVESSADSEQAKRVKRASSMRKKVRPGVSVSDSEKTPRRRTSKQRPSYDWSKHSSRHGGGDMNWTEHAKNVDELDESQGCAAKTA